MPKRRVHRHAVDQPQDQSIRLIPLTQGQNATVDAADYEWLSQWNWYTFRDKRIFYAKRRNGRKYMPMHRQILGCPGQVDHWDGNGLNNRRNNLRPCTQSQNRANAIKRCDNTSPYRGVRFHLGKWEAQIKVSGKNIYLGRFATPEEAKESYDQAAIFHYGEFAVQNRPR